MYNMRSALRGCRAVKFDPYNNMWSSYTTYSYSCSIVHNIILFVMILWSVSVILWKLNKTKRKCYVLLCYVYPP